MPKQHGVRAIYATAEPVCMHSYTVEQMEWNLLVVDVPLEYR